MFERQRGAFIDDESPSAADVGAFADDHTPTVASIGVSIRHKYANVGDEYAKADETIANRTPIGAFAAHDYAKVASQYAKCANGYANAAGKCVTTYAKCANLDHGFANISDESRFLPNDFAKPRSLTTSTLGSPGISAA